MAATIETLEVLPGEGVVKTIRKTRFRVGCGNCGEAAHFKHTYLLPDARRNPQSAAYGRDDCSWSEDHAEFVCKGCPHPKIDGYKWCSTFYATEQFAHMFLKWREEEI